MSASKSNVINGISDNNKIGRAKTKARSFSGKNQIWIMAKSKFLIKSEKHDFFKFIKASGSGFFIFKASQVLTKLKHGFGEAPILYHFDLKYYIWVETDISNYVISGVLCQLTSDNLG